MEGGEGLSGVPGAGTRVCRGMNHERTGAARPLSAGASARVVLCAAALAVLPGLPARGQAGISDLPAMGEIDPKIDPFPFDARRSLRDYLKVKLPGGWWANEPEFSLGMLSATIHVPAGWQGNPTSAVMGLCPPRENVLWRHVQRLELVPFYRNARRTGTVCRP